MGNGMLFENGVEDNIYVDWFRCGAAEDLALVVIAMHQS